MKTFCLLVVALHLSQLINAQNQLKIQVKNEDNNTPLSGASVIFPTLNKGISTDSSGMAFFHDLPSGVYQLEISYVGFTTAKQKIILPYLKGVLEIELEPANVEDNPDVVVSATRTDRSIRNTPTRVEVIAGGEISENVSMRPGEIKMLLNETTGIITQQTSAISNSSTLRIQELDGRYTQVLRDGFPLYSGLSEGLSLVQISPLDLKQVEIIKGSSSTLFGGGAIAGLINLVSKTPGEKRELSFLANGTSTKGFDVSGFYSNKFDKAGISLFAARNSGSAYDPSGTGLTAIPKFQRYTFTPRLFFYGTKTNINLGVTCINEKRVGGNINYIKHGTAGYFEKNKSNRIASQLSITRKLNDHTSLNFKNSYNHFNRKINLPSYQFEGLQQSSFSEFSWNTSEEKIQWVAGINFYTDHFDEENLSAVNDRSYHLNTVGGFLQNTWSPSESISLESGIRTDHTNDYGFIFLPRLSLLFHFSENFTSRLGGGFGYKSPGIFNEESEELQFKNVLPINTATAEYELSKGGNIDFTWKRSFDEIKLVINPLFFYTRINHPLYLKTLGNGYHEFINANGYSDSKGVDLSIRLTRNAIKFFSGYSYTIAKNHLNGSSSLYLLAPKHRLHLDLVYEKEGKLRMALESYYTGKQLLGDGTFGKSYWLLGGLIEKSWKHFSLFINGEDLNDVRQTKWGSIFTGTIDSPVFKDIYAPLEGVTINAGIKVKL